MNTRAARTPVTLIGCFVICLLVVSCSSPARSEASPADISVVRLGSPQTPPLRVRVTAYGILSNSCERLGGVTQRLEGRTFFIEIAKFSPSASAECAAVIIEFEKEVVLELEGLADGVYTVDVNDVTETFELIGLTHTLQMKKAAELDHELSATPLGLLSISDQQSDQLHADVSSGA